MQPRIVSNMSAPANYSVPGQHARQMGANASQMGANASHIAQLQSQRSQIPDQASIDKMYMGNTEEEVDQSLKREMNNLETLLAAEESRIQSQHQLKLQEVSNWMNEQKARLQRESEYSLTQEYKKTETELNDQLLRLEKQAIDNQHTINSMARRAIFEVHMSRVESACRRDVQMFKRNNQLQHDAVEIQHKDRQMTIQKKYPEISRAPPGQSYVPPPQKSQRHRRN